MRHDPNGVEESNMTQLPPLFALLRKEADLWVLQCLDYDIAVQGKTLPDVEQAFERTLNAHILIDVQSGRQPLASVPSAPELYWNLFREARHMEPLRIRVVAPVHGRPSPSKPKKAVRGKTEMQPVYRPRAVQA